MDKLEELSYFMYDKIKQHNFKKILCPAPGSGIILKPFQLEYDIYKNEYNKRNDLIVGIDLEKTENPYTDIIETCNYLEWQNKDNKKFDLVIFKSPISKNEANKKYLKQKKLGKAMLCDLFLQHTFNILGHKQKVISIVPMGFRLNNRKTSKRVKAYKTKFHNANITGIISLPLDFFPGIQMHVEVLFWNIELPEFHYWY